MRYTRKPNPAGATTLRLDRRRFFCEHCKEDVARSTYLAHKRKYFNADEGTWKDARDMARSRLALGPASYRCTPGNQRLY